MESNQNKSQAPLTNEQLLEKTKNFFAEKPCQKLDVLNKGKQYKITGWKKVSKPKYKEPKVMEITVILELGDIKVWAPAKFAAADDSYLDCLVANEFSFTYYGKKNGYHNFKVEN